MNSGDSLALASQIVDTVYLIIKLSFDNVADLVCTLGRHASNGDDPKPGQDDSSGRVGAIERRSGESERIPG